MPTDKPLIAVFGATGHQGGAVLRALRDRGDFAVRAITRNAATAQLDADEIVEANLNDIASLRRALTGVSGVFAVTNFWEPGTDEFAQGRSVVDAARDAGVRHFVWSTLPNVEAISHGAHEVPHFTNKAKVNALVADAGFEFFTFVEAPSYFQNLTQGMGPTPQTDGTSLWTVPIDPAAQVLHLGDIREFGPVVASAFAHPEQAGAGQILAHASELLSWNMIVETLNHQGHRCAVRQVAPEIYDTFYAGASEVRSMMQYFEKHTYFGPDAEQKIALARQVSAKMPTPFADWSSKHMPA